MTDDLNEAIKEALPIVATAFEVMPLYEDRCLMGFTSTPVCIVAPRGTSQVGLAVLLLEQAACLRAMQGLELFEAKVQVGLQ